MDVAIESGLIAEQHRELIVFDPDPRHLVQRLMEMI